MEKFNHWNSFCEICGKPRGGHGAHVECSKEVKKRHANDKRKPKSRSKNLDELATYISRKEVA